MLFPSISDIQRNLTAVWAVFRGNRDAIRQDDASYEGFWRSFAAIVLLIPLYIAFVMSEIAVIESRDLIPAEFSPTWHAAVRAISIVIDWVGYPLLMLVMARPLGIASRYATYIAAYNWSSVIISVPLALPGILLGLGMISTGIAGALMLVGLAVFVRMRFVVARAALEVSVATAAGLVLLDFLLGLALAELFDRMTGL